MRDVGLDRLGRTTVQRHPLPGVQTGDDRVPDEVVGEPPLPRSLALDYQRGARRLVQHVRQSPTLLPVIAATTGTANRVPSTAAARSDAAQSRGEPPEPLADRVEHGPGYGPRERGPVGQLAGKLADEERVASRRVEHRSQFGVAGCPPNNGGYQLADGGPLQATQLDLGRTRLLGQSGEGAGCVPAADHDKETVVACCAREVLHQQLRRFVRAVQIVEDDEQRATSSRPRARAGRPRRTSARAPPATALHRSG